MVTLRCSAGRFNCFETFEFQWDEHRTVYEAIISARAAASMHGWKTAGRDDICPDCQRLFEESRAKRERAPT